MCPALISDSLKFKCTFNGEDVDCSKPMKNGTTVIPSCKVTHHLPNGEPYPLISLTCLSDGKWDQLFFQCVPCNYIYCKLLSYIKIYIYTYVKLLKYRFSLW